MMDYILTWAFFALLGLLLGYWLRGPRKPCPTVSSLRAKLAAQERTIRSLSIQADLDRMQVYTAQMRAK